MNLKIDKSNWKKVKLNDVCEWYQKNIPNEIQFELGIKYYVTATHIDSDSIKFNRFNLLSDGQKGPTITKHFQKGDLLLSTRSVELRKAALAPIDGVTGEKLLVIRLKANSQLTKDLMPFVFQSSDFWEFAQNSASGSVNKFTSWTKIREYEFLLPPKEEQSKLAELLWAMDEVIEKEKEVLEKLHVNKQSYEKSTLKKFKTDISIPNGFKMFNLSDIAEISGGSTPSREKKEYWNGNIPWLTPTDVTNHNQINLLSTKEYITDLGLKDIANRIYPVGTILFCSRATIGYAVINDTPMCTNQGFSNFIVNEKVDNYYLYFLLRFNTPELTRLAGGSTFLEIAKSDIRKFKVLIPDIITQISVKKILLDFEKNRKFIESKILGSKTLQKSLINQVF